VGRQDIRNGAQRDSALTRTRRQNAETGTFRNNGEVGDRLKAAVGRVAGH
jgi:hypothetical protein